MLEDSKKTNPINNDDEEVRHEQVLREQRLAQERALRENLPGFNRKYYLSTPEEIAQQIEDRELK